MTSEVGNVLQSTTPVHPTFTQGAYADDYLGLTGTAGDCQIMADACRSQSLKWRWVPNLGVDKTAIVVFEPKIAPVTANVSVMWDNKVITVQNTYRLLGVTFSSSGKWDAHLAKLHINAKGRINQREKLLYNKDLDTSILKIMLIKTCLLPVLEYGSDVWHASKSQAGLLKTQYLRVLKMVLQCPTATPTVAVLHDYGMLNLQSLWDLNKMRFANRPQNMADTRLPKSVFGTTWVGRGSNLSLTNLR